MGKIKIEFSKALVLKVVIVSIGLLLLLYLAFEFKDWLARNTGDKIARSPDIHKFT